MSDFAKVDSVVHMSFLERYLVKYVGTDRNACVVCGFYLGTLFTLGWYLLYFSEMYFDLGLYLIAVSMFHMWEYFYVSIFKPQGVNVSSFLIDHSIEFFIAFVFSYCEYFFEKLYLQDFILNYFKGNNSSSLWVRLGKFLFSNVFYKGNPWFVYPAIILVMIGQMIRTISMIQCGTNFSHRIELEKRDDHVLITSGLYKYFRHPSYFGWFYWCVFTQVVLGNPISMIGYFGAAWKFFRDRILVEELLLCDQFGDSYVAYRKKAGIYIPFIKTSHIEEFIREHQE